MMSKSLFPNGDDSERNMPQTPAMRWGNKGKWQYSVQWYTKTGEPLEC